MITIDPNPFIITFHCAGFAATTPVPFALEFPEALSAANYYYKVTVLSSSGSLTTSVDIDFTLNPPDISYKHTSFPYPLGTHLNRPDDPTPPTNICTGTLGIELSLNITTSVDGQRPTPPPPPIPKPYDKATHKG